MDSQHMPSTSMVVAYFGLIAANALVALGGLIAVPNVWVRRVSVSFLWANGIILLFTGVFLANVALATGLRGEGGLAFFTFAAITTPVVIQFFILLAIYYFKLRRWTFPLSNQS